MKLVRMLCGTMLLCLLCGFSAVGLQNTVYAETASNQTVMKTICDAFDSMSSEIDLSSYQLTKDDLSGIMQDITNKKACYFFVSSSYSYHTSGSYISKVYPKYKYSKSECKTMTATVEAELKKLLSGYNPKWTDFETALYFHDLIASAYSYEQADGNGKYHGYDIYYLLTEGEGVCQAYTLLYSELLNRCGVETSYSSSDEMVHVWSLVKVDGEWYHVDVTWDDPVVDRYGRAEHLCFLKSDKGIASEDLGTRRHTGFVNADGIVCSSELYDNSGLTAVKTPFVTADGLWYGISASDGVCRSYDFHSGKLTGNKIFTVSEKWGIYGTNSAYSEKFTSLIGNDGKLYYNTPSTVCEYNVATGKTRTVYALSKSEAGYIFYMKKEDGAISCAVLPNANETPDTSSLRTVDYPGETFTVEYRNEDGTLLKSFTVSAGDSVPTVQTTPVKDDTAKYHYTFEKWSGMPDGGKVTSDLTLTAVFKEEIRKYTYTFYDASGKVLLQGTAEYGTAIPSPEKNPEKASDASYEYTFSEWDGYAKGMKLTGNAEFTPIFTRTPLKPEIPSEFTSTSYLLRAGYLFGILPKTTVSALLQTIPERDYVTVLSPEGKTLTSSSKIGTGAQVAIYDGTTAVFSTTAVVTGDVSGDGDMTLTDLIRLKSHLLGKSTLTSAPLQAADLNEDSKVSDADFDKMASSLLGN